MIVDANVLVSAVIGRSAPLVFGLRERGVRLLAPVPQIVEAWRVLARRFGADQRWRSRMDALMMIVNPITEDRFAAFEQTARARLDEGGQPDWAVLAAALATDMPVWSNDRDLFGTGVAVWSTINIQHMPARAGEK